MDLLEHLCTRLARTSPWDGFVRRATPAPTRSKTRGKKKITCCTRRRGESHQRGARRGDHEVAWSNL